MQLLSPDQPSPQVYKYTLVQGDPNSIAQGGGWIFLLQGPIKPAIFLPYSGRRKPCPFKT